jgi:hypothetical protein
VLAFDDPTGEKVTHCRCRSTVKPGNRNSLMATWSLNHSE